MDSSALNVVKKYWYTAPVDVYAAIREVGVELVFLQMSDDYSQLSGYIESAGDNFRIAVNASDHEVRQRFTAAHELGHYMFHRSLIGEGVDDNRLYRSERGGKYYNTKIGRQHDIQANQFAANLLMPSHLVAKLKLQGTTTPEQLAAALKVSRPAMRIRLGLSPEPEPADVRT